MKPGITKSNTNALSKIPLNTSFLRKQESRKNNKQLKNKLDSRLCGNDNFFGYVNIFNAFVLV